MDLVVVDEPSCKDAAVELGKQFEHATDSSRHPSGCFTNFRHAYFNQKIDPSTTSSSLYFAGICRSSMVVNFHRV